MVIAVVILIFPLVELFLSSLVSYISGSTFCFLRCVHFSINYCANDLIIRTKYAPIAEIIRRIRTAPASSLSS